MIAIAIEVFFILLSSVGVSIFLAQILFGNEQERGE